MLIALPALLLNSSCTAGLSQSQPTEINTIQHEAETCQHLAGEWDSDLSAERLTQIEGEMAQSCRVLDEQ